MAVALGGAPGPLFGLRAAGNVPAPGSLTLSVNVVFTAFQPGQLFTLVLESDRNGDQIREPLSSIRLRNEIAPPQPVRLTITLRANGSLTLTWPSED